MNDFVLGQEEYEDAPKDYQVKIEHAYYKLGRHNKPYIFVGQQWIRSTRDPQEIYNAIREADILRNHAHKD